MFIRVPLCVVKCGGDFLFCYLSIIIARTKKLLYYIWYNNKMRKFAKSELLTHNIIRHGTKQNYYDNRTGYGFATNACRW